MAYVTPTTRADGYVITPANWAQDIVANEAAMAPDIFTTAGDMEVGTGVNTSTRLPIGTDGQVLIVSGGTPAWAPEPDAAMVYYGFWFHSGVIGN